MDSVGGRNGQVNDLLVDPVRLKEGCSRCDVVHHDASTCGIDIAGSHECLEGPGEAEFHAFMKDIMLFDLAVEVAYEMKDQ